MIIYPATEDQKGKTTYIHSLSPLTPRAILSSKNTNNVGIVIIIYYNCYRKGEKNTSLQPTILEQQTKRKNEDKKRV